jgi:hypothetical protein
MCTSIQGTRVGDVGSGSPPEPAAPHAARMDAIHLHTVADLLARQHTLGLYCHYCDRWAEAPLEQLAHDGWSRTPLARLRFRCAICGGPAQRQLRPPALPTAPPATGWTSPGTPRIASA